MQGNLFLGSCCRQQNHDRLNPCLEGRNSCYHQKKGLDLNLIVFPGNHGMNVDELLPTLKDFVEGRCEAADVKLAFLA